MNEDRLSTAGSCRIVFDNALLQPRHLAERNGLRRFRYALNHAGILNGKEPFRDFVEEKNRQQQRRHRDQQA